MSKVRSFTILLASVTVGAVAAAAQAEKAAGDASLNDALGVYSGPFGPNTITVRLEKMEGNTASGYSEVGKNRRPFSGSVAVRDGVPRFDVREPGDNPQDGAFRFQFLPDQKTLVGTWTPNDRKLTDVSFTLAKRGQTEENAKSSTADGDRQETAATSGYTDGTFVRFDPPDGMKEPSVTTNANRLVIKDANGREHSFEMYRAHARVGFYNYPGPELVKKMIGDRKRIYWESGVDPRTGKSVKFADEITEPGVEIYWPEAGSTEEKAITDAVRAAYRERFKKRPTFRNDKIKAGNGWACFVGLANEPDEPGGKRGWHAVLRGGGAKWQVVDADEDNRKLLQRILRKHPAVPGDVRVILNFY
ncbi:MAG TPA: hypothetical protein VK993_04010 [Chthoniobacterales bacterium]|nr:hypothetical protein [Chthoniobacterales bacterium]